MPEMQIPKKLQRLVYTPKRFKVAIGGRGGAKSNTIADILLMKSQTESAKIGCFREYQNSIEDSVHSLLKNEISRLELRGFKIGKAAIDNNFGGGFRFKGLSRAMDSVKSMDGFKYFWVEEGQFLSGDSIKILTPTVRVEGGEIWFTGNPMSSADPFSQRFIVPFKAELDKNGFYEDDMHLIVVVNYDDNPWFPDVLEKERQYDYKTMDRALYDHIWRGAFNDTVENSIIRAEWFDACVDAHLKLGFPARGQKIVAHDPSDLGPDDKGLAMRHGSVVIEACSQEFGDVNNGCDWATDYAINHNADIFTWDCDGMGVSLKRQVKSSFVGKKIDNIQFRGSNGAENPDDIYEDSDILITDETKSMTNKQTFKNRRAQYYWRLRDRIYNTYLATKGQYKDPDTMLSFSSEIQNLQQVRSEVCRIPRKPNGNGLIQIMTKEEMKRLLKIQSPNVADAVMMLMCEPAPKNDLVGYSPCR